MTNKEKLAKLESAFNEICYKNCGHGGNENCICGNAYFGIIESLYEALDKLERLEKKKI